MSDLRDFLNWFDGFSENIGKQPSSQQWEKIKARILALKDVADAPIGHPFPPRPAAPVGLQKPTTPAQWKAQYIQFMCEQGCDIETAQEFADGIERVNLAEDVKARAEADFKAIVN